MNQDPFDLLRDRLIVAAGGPTKTGRRGGLAVILAALVLAVAAAAAAAVTLTDGEEPEPKTGAQPSPSPGATPSPSPSPSSTPRPNQTPGTARPPSARPRPGPTTPPSTLPPPTAPIDYRVELMPDLTAGVAGWCVGVSRQGSGLRMGGRGCGPAGPPGTHLIAAGGLIGRQGLMYAVVDRSVTSVQLSNGRRITPQRDPSIPSAWRMAIWDVSVLPGGRPPAFTLHDVTGRELSARPSLSGRGVLPTRKVNAKRPPKARCAIRAKAGSGLRAVSARLLTDFETLDVVRPSFLSCSASVFHYGGRRYRAALLLNARDLQAAAPPLPSAPNSISARRAGPGWLVVFGGTTPQREHVLSVLRVRRP